MDPITLAAILSAIVGGGFITSDLLKTFKGSYKDQKEIEIAEKALSGEREANALQAAMLQADRSQKRSDRRQEMDVMRGENALDRQAASHMQTLMLMQALAGASSNRIGDVLQGGSSDLAAQRAAMQSQSVNQDMQSLIGSARAISPLGRMGF